MAVMGTPARRGGKGSAARGYDPNPARSVLSILSICIVDNSPASRGAGQTVRALIPRGGAREYRCPVDLQHWLSDAVAAIEEWQNGFGPYQADPSMLVSDERFADAFGELTGRLRNNYPF